MVKMKRFVFLLGLIGGTFLISTLVAGCATGLSQQSRQKVTYDGGFKPLQQNPASYIDEVMLLGGRIIEVQAGEDGSRVKVLQLPVDRFGKPVEGDNSEGRFIIVADQFLDPYIYTPATRISMVGVLTGSEVSKIGEYDYQYPLFRPLEIKVWSPQEQTTPRIHFGIGVGARF